jgi:hypothetical protein
MTRTIYLLGCALTDLLIALLVGHQAPNQGRHTFASPGSASG